MNVKKLKWRFYRKEGGGRQIGNRCKDYAAGCIVCDCYKFKDENGHFPYTLEEASEYSDEQVRLEHEAEQRLKALEEAATAEIASLQALINKE